MKKTLLVVLVLSALLGCKKDADVAPPSKRDLLTKSAWIQTTGTLSPAINNVTDYFNTLDACTKDDVFRYATDGKYTGEEGATKCAPMDPQIFDQGTWQLTQDEKQLVLSAGGQSATRDILLLTDQQLQLRYTASLNGTLYTLTDTYKPAP